MQTILLFSQRSAVVLEKEDHGIDLMLRMKKSGMNKEIPWCLSPVNCLFNMLLYLLEKL